MTALATSGLTPLPARTPFYYGWVNVAVAALAMVATLPGRTQGLGLITEPLLRDLGLGRVDYARLNLVATLAGSLFCIGFGRLVDRWGARGVMATVAGLLGCVVLAMSRAEGFIGLAAALVFTRGLGQSALSAVSISLVGHWFRARLEPAMAAFSVLLSVGFMAAFPLVGAAVERTGWRPAWAGLGLGVLGVAALAAVFARRSPDHAGVADDDRGDDAPGPESTLGEALRTPAFWIFGLASALYGLVASGIGLFNENILAELGHPARLYHQTLAVTALTALAGNFIGGWLGRRHSPGRLMAVAMFLLAAGLAALPHLHTVGRVYAQAVGMGLAGGFVTVLFFSFWSRTYGRRHLGQIQGAAQMLTVVASAIGPLLLASAHGATGSYAPVFRTLAALVGLLGAAALAVRTANTTRG